MRKNPSRSRHTLSSAPEPMVQRWVLRILTHPTNLLRLSASQHTLDSFQSVLPSFLDTDDDADDWDGTSVAFVRALDMLDAAQEHETSNFSRNVLWLSKALGLDTAEQNILSFAIAATGLDIVKEAINLAEPRSRKSLEQIVGLALDLPSSKVHKALGQGATLSATGLVHIEHNMGYSDNMGLQVPDTLTKLLVEEFEDQQQLQQLFHSPVHPPRLSVDDFDFMSEKLDYLTALFETAMKEHTEGVNVLLYGPPGVGKTELTRLLISRLGATGYAVKASPDDDSRRSYTDRLDAFTISQRVLQSSRDTLLVFDEADEAIGQTSGGTGLFARFFGGLEPEKLSQHHYELLETNRVPAVWIGNQFKGKDPAWLRRFSMVVEMGLPPRRVRERMLRKHTRGLGLSETWLSNVASSTHVTPGIMASAAQTTSLIAKSRDIDPERLISEVIDGHLTVQGVSRRQQLHPEDLGPIDLSLVNTDIDLEHLTDALKKSRRGTALLWGPPGTGKTAFVHHLADELGAPLLVRRASDLLDMWVGSSEKLIAEMFVEATDERAVLLLDEADGLLRQRSGDSKSWELTRVNELLQQMEAFEGLFFCATNLVEQLDEASLRRFAFKVQFRPADAGQRLELLKRSLKMLDPAIDVLKAIDQQVRAQVCRLDGATPGDFAAVTRRMGILGEPADPAVVLRGVRDELRLRGHRNKRPVGFAA